jgi:hypothetical protein
MVGTLDRTSADHQWHERREPHLKIETGDAVVQHHCDRCGRDIVTVLSSGARHAVYASVFSFYRLDDELTQRWLSEPCPGERLARDDKVRKKFDREVRRDGPGTENRLGACPRNSQLEM